MTERSKGNGGDRFIKCNSVAPNEREVHWLRWFLDIDAHMLPK